jgi:plastocyanin
MRKLAVVFAVLVFLAPTSLGAATKGVKVKDNFFTPKNVGVRVGDFVHWTRAGDSFGIHNVHGERNFFISGAPTMGSINLTVRFSAGNFYYRCDLHGGANMEGFVRVPPTLSAAPTGLPFTVRWANAKTKTGGRYAVQFRGGSSKTWRTWKPDTVTGSAIFGKSKQPVALTNGKKYSFRARSKNKKGASRWSEVRTFRP